MQDQIREVGERTGAVVKASCEAAAHERREAQIRMLVGFGVNPDAIADRLVACLEGAVDRAGQQASLAKMADALVTSASWLAMGDRASLLVAPPQAHAELSQEDHAAYRAAAERVYGPLA